MKRPENYVGPLGSKVPLGYIDVTFHTDPQRKGYPCMDHPYYVLRDKIQAAIDSAPNETTTTKLAELVMEVL